MNYIRSLTEEQRLDWSLFQYTARRLHIVHYRVKKIRAPDNRVLYYSELEQCPACVQPYTGVTELTHHLETAKHIAYVADIPLEKHNLYHNSPRHDAMRYILKMYRLKSDSPLLSTATVESVLRVIENEIELDTDKLITPQIEALIGILQRHAPKYYQQREHFWAMTLLGSIRD